MQLCIRKVVRAHPIVSRLPIEFSWGLRTNVNGEDDHVCGSFNKACLGTWSTTGTHTTGPGRKDSIDFSISVLVDMRYCDSQRKSYHERHTGHHNLEDLEALEYRIGLIGWSADSREKTNLWQGRRRMSSREMLWKLH